jgi:hypothetical protein
MRERERGGARVEHDRDVPGGALEEPVDLLAERLERLEHGRSLGTLRGVVASGEGGRVRLLPGHARNIRGLTPLKVKGVRPR